MTNMRIALFGTSADPPTAGHQAIISWLSESYDRVAVWAADNPFKSHQTVLIHRAAMLQLLIDDIQPPRPSVHLHQELSSFRSIETVEKAKQAWGEDNEFILVVGSDLLKQLPKWYRIEDLLQQVELLVVPRPGYAIDEANLERLRQMGGRVAIANLTGPDISSTAYREHGDSHALTPHVEAYIQREHLYKCEDAPKKSLQIR